MKRKNLQLWIVQCKTKIATKNKQLDSCKCTHRSEQFEYMSKFCWSKNWSLFFEHRALLRHTFFLFFVSSVFSSCVFDSIHGISVLLYTVYTSRPLNFLTSLRIGKRNFHFFCIQVRVCTHSSGLASTFWRLFPLQYVFVFLFYSSIFFVLLFDLRFSNNKSHCNNFNTIPFKLSKFIFVSNRVVHCEVFDFLK